MSRLFWLTEEQIERQAGSIKGAETKGGMNTKLHTLRDKQGDLRGYI